MTTVKFICRTEGKIVELDELKYLKEPDLQHQGHDIYWIQRPTLKAPEEIIEEEIAASPNGLAMPSLDDDVKQIRDVMNALNTVVFERQDVIKALFLSVIARQHMIMYGLPGTGKNWLVQKFSESIEHKYWEYQISQNTVLEELYGAWDLIAMRDTGRMVRNIEGTLLQAEIALLDEIGNSSSPIRNALKWLMNERKYRDADEIRLAPIQTIVSASNSMLDVEDATEAAFEDRYLVRYVIPDDIESDDNRRAMLMLRNKKSQLPIIPHEVITRLQTAVQEVEITEEFANQAIAMQRAIAEDSAAGNCTVSPRRLRQTMDLAAAHAILSGRKKLRRNDLIVYGLTFWKSGEDARERAQQLNEYLKVHLTTTLSKIEAFDSDVDQIFTAFKQSVDETNVSDIEKMQKGTMSQAQLKGLMMAVQNVRRQAEDKDEIDAADAVEKKVKDYVAQIARISLDFDDSSEYDDLSALKKVR
jgi:MoxR-like ATPase